jgi:hypothetical protein
MVAVSETATEPRSRFPISNQETTIDILGYSLLGKPPKTSLHSLESKLLEI